MTVTSTDIANQAIYLMGNNQAEPVTGTAPNFDDSAAGVALRYLYSACVQTVGRQWEWDMARNTVALSLSGNIAPSPWFYEYTYPANGVQVWQLCPATTTDYNDPRATNWVVANAVVSGTQRRVIHTDLANAIATYNNNPSEDSWDAGFREAVVRLLASELAIALGGQPETSKMYFETGTGIMNAAKARSD